ncbi:MAG: dockerin type I domain-containing protein [bacterium]
MAPSIEQNIWRAYQDEEFQALGVDVWNGSANQVRSFYQQPYDITYPLLLNGSSVGATYGVAQDYYFVIDREGIVQYRSTGGLGQRYDEETIIDKIEELLAACSKGDVDLNGEVNVLDVVFAVNFILDQVQPDSAQFCAADFNGDGTVNVLDLVGIVNKILGTPKDIEALFEPNNLGPEQSHISHRRMDFLKRGGISQ